MRPHRRCSQGLGKHLHSSVSPHMRTSRPNRSSKPRQLAMILIRRSASQVLAHPCRLPYVTLEGTAPTPRFREKKTIRLKTKQLAGPQAPSVGLDQERQLTFFQLMVTANERGSPRAPLNPRPTSSAPSTSAHHKREAKQRIIDGTPFVDQPGQRHRASFRPVQLFFLSPSPTPRWPRHRRCASREL